MGKQTLSSQSSFQAMQFAIFKQRVKLTFGSVKTVWKIKNMSGTYLKMSGNLKMIKSSHVAYENGTNFANKKKSVIIYFQNEREHTSQTSQFF